MGAAVAAVFLGTLWYASRGPELASSALARAPESVASGASPRATPPAASAVGMPSAGTPAATLTEPTPAAVAQWIADTQHIHAKTRAAAIDALARAPRAQAIPALRRVLLGGEPEIDRPLALQSLRELARTQGDADGAIREAVREVIYHGEDASPAAAAQEALDAIEASQSASQR
jgi:hypothetical protein